MITWLVTAVEHLVVRPALVEFHEYRLCRGGTCDLDHLRAVWLACSPSLTDAA